MGANNSVERANKRIDKALMRTRKTRDEIDYLRAKNENLHQSQPPQRQAPTPPPRRQAPNPPPSRPAPNPPPTRPAPQPPQPRQRKARKSYVIGQNDEPENDEADHHQVQGRRRNQQPPPEQDLYEGYTVQSGGYNHDDYGYGYPPRSSSYGGYSNDVYSSNNNGGYSNDVYSSNNNGYQQAYSNGNTGECSIM